jgi:hypothetical protein
MIRGVSREVELNVSYHGEWLTPWWEEEAGMGRQGSEGASRIRRKHEDQPPRFRSQLE